MSKTHSGSCLCGEVRFEIKGAFEHFYLCHCQHCRKDTGSAHAANLFSSAAHLSWVSGEEHIRLFNLPSTRHSKCFCGLCGSALPFTQEAGKLLVVPAGSLDSDIEIAPAAHIFCSSKANWDTGLHTIPGFDTLPG
ncbi:MAG TPA: GFA family protein [Myxococcaceae bacterium]|nr:GFA family protein [Myxococcaceae bacterium]